MLSSVARACFRHKWRTLGAWLVVLVSISALGSTFAGTWASQGRLPGTDSQAAQDILEREFPGRSGDSGAVVVGDVGRDRARVEALLASVATVPGVARVGALEVAPDGRIAQAEVTFAEGLEEAATSTAVDAVKELVDEVRAAGVGVELSGEWFGEGGMPASEIVGLLAALVILVVAFGSLVAAGVPILTAVVGVGIAMAGVNLWANVFDTASFTPHVAAMIGIGVGIDYALFILTRYRAAVDRGADREDAVAEAMSTAGRAVVFAGCTVVVSLLGMFVMGLSFLHGLAVGTSCAVLVAVVAAVTLVPAVLGITGRRIDSLHIGRRRTPSTAGGLWARWARFVQHRPAAVAGAGLVVLLLMAAPALVMRLGFADQGNDPSASTTRRAHDLLVSGFGAGSTGPIAVVMETSVPGSAGAVDQVLAELRRQPGVASVTPALASESGAAAIAQLVPVTGPQDDATVDLLGHLRSDVVPVATAGTGIEVRLGGQTAAGIDFAEVISRRLPWFVGSVLALSFLLLLGVFRSVLVPLKAVVMNLLSIGAAYGVLVVVFQWGWAGELLGVSGQAPIEPWAPMMLFAIVFGLSMDYEVFLLSAVREAYDRTGDNAEAVVEGLSSTARVITAAAAIMVSVFGTFVLSDVRELKLIGLGLAVAVAVDATLVRIVLVPATMELLGRANWWLPRWLDRVVPRIAVDTPPTGDDSRGPDPEERHRFGQSVGSSPR
ncbi:MAG TPA: MMPL family transporter [Acidimicrobiales bacterium]|nr:MMPL family transporter [Acidimicrobiales bacterium]